MIGVGAKKQLATPGAVGPATASGNGHHSACGVDPAGKARRKQQRWRQILPAFGTIRPIAPAVPGSLKT